MSKLSKETILMVKDLQSDLEDLLKLDSNIEVVWKSEKLQEEKALQKKRRFYQAVTNPAT